MKLVLKPQKEKRGKFKHFVANGNFVQRFITPTKIINHIQAGVVGQTSFRKIRPFYKIRTSNFLTDQDNRTTWSASSGVGGAAILLLWSKYILGRPRLKTLRSSSQSPTSASESPKQNMQVVVVISTTTTTTEEHKNYAHHRPHNRHCCC